MRFDYSSRHKSFKYFLRFFLRPCGVCAFFGFVWVAGYCALTLLAYPHGLLSCSPFIGILGLWAISQGCCCVGVDRLDDSSADSSASFAQCCRCGGFFPSFAIFRASLGTSALSSEFSLLFLVSPYGVPFFAPSVSSPLLSLLL